VIKVVSKSSKLLKTVGLLAVRLDLAKLRLKNRKKISHFRQKSESSFFTQIGTLLLVKKSEFFGCQNKNKSQKEECHFSLSSLFNF